ncbi:SAM-dependent methyltransferase [Fluoribacter dumoffii]|uniref:Ribosomal RNA large subunit methyltransferase M n=1 Tax=Fluoribacter dumoffii TaxID=463 RepID=A0A377G9C9_9GAMM|nr:SAM-dependent methyltransferase [Fluoribacter dumoffii]KTC90295.1 methyltransferase [Fluoribacter dumoffii NY 23]STO21415.1 Ribosomal RNA large subunit methyltransferase M [Fluoribacter dumoffii]
MENKIAAIYVIKPEFRSILSEELGEGTYIGEDLVCSPHKNLDVCFAQDIWMDPQVVTFQSISEGVRILRQAGKFWYLHPISHIRRSRLIEEQLRHLPQLARHFPFECEIPSVGVFGLLDKNTMVYSATRQKKWPQGKCLFIEDKTNPPNRAYLKLWEALTLLGKYPKPGDKDLDLGASPGGWTYVMQSLGASVTAVDKASLDPEIAKRPNITYVQQSAFAIDPLKSEHHYDWVLSDVACYPDRAYALIMKWIASEKAKQMIFTIKLQGKIELSTIKQFQNIPNSYITNMYYNKHEATFLYPFCK